MNRLTTVAISVAATLITLAAMKRFTPGVRAMIG